MQRKKVNIKSKGCMYTKNRLVNYQYMRFYQAEKIFTDFLMILPFLLSTRDKIIDFFLKLEKTYNNIQLNHLFYRFK